jgi:hypothetical protein
MAAKHGTSDVRRMSVSVNISKSQAFHGTNCPHCSTLDAAIDADAGRTLSRD